MDLMIGERIKNRRKELHLTGKQIKDAVGISTGNLSDIENGKILPSSSALIGLSKVLECSCDYILLGKSHISESSSNSNIRDSERILLEQFRNLPDDDQEENLPPQSQYSLPGSVQVPSFPHGSLLAPSPASDTQALQTHCPVPPDLWT